MSEVEVRPGHHSAHNLWMERADGLATQIGCVFDPEDAGWVGLALSDYLHEHPGVARAVAERPRTWNRRATT